MKVSLKQVLLTTLAATVLFAGNVYAGTTYDKVKNDGTVNVGLMYNSIPAAFFNEKNEWVGFDIDIATEVVKRIGTYMEKDLTINKVKVNNKTRISFLTSDRIDLSVANMTHKRERDKTIDFSITYFFDGQKIMTKKGKYSDPKDLVGKRVCAMQGTTSEKNLVNLLKSLGDENAEKNVISFQTAPDCFLALAQGKVEAWSTDSTILLGFAAKQAGMFELIGDFISDEPYGMGLPEDDSKWRDAVNFAIQDLWTDGTYMEIYNKWYGPDTPYYFPMTAKIEMWP
ncbi:amino acid ABC transporter substrate-binding protein [Desulfoluna limicola]|uniref:Amino acid ABC transporter substrate-binding protein n=1 Tax=Desulfoluna limicola TaxID=2810562 RepID=A0ABM7PKJ0_9BACT|nr:transporter substrate-binding domain-containing protein [Desulfoluna limicola]BCS97619.1 amino acid ABC transporter substrate-binding protein [Desulfoluna limicola]